VKQDQADEIARRFDSEPDFVGVRAVDFSLDKLVEKYPDGVPRHIMAAAMGKVRPPDDPDAGKPDEDAVEEEIEAVVLKLRTLMGVTPDDLVEA